MKRTKRSFAAIILTVILITATSAIAEIVYTNQVTIAYDAVAPIEPTDVITYQIWIDSSATGVLMVGETDLLIYTITFILEGGYLVGVGTKRELGIGEIVYSDINWSNEDIPVGATLIPFVVRYIKPIQSPENLRLP